MRVSYYDVLDVAPTAGEDEIKARYLALMRRYHPDVNRSPLAHVRTAQIGEALHTLTDAALRARHDAELAQDRLDAVSARAINLWRAGRRRARGVRRRYRLLRRYGARLALVALLAATALAGWQIEQRLAGGNAAVTPLDSRDDTNSAVRQTVAALNAASIAEAQAMPPVSTAAVAEGAGAFQRLAAGGNLAQARAFSERCHAEAVDGGTWEALDFCVAFDQAAFLHVGKGAAAFANAGYFVDRHDGAAHLYVPRLSSLDAIGMRLDRIRGQVAPVPDDRLQARAAHLLHRVVKRGWKLAGAVFDPSRVDRGATARKARDF